MVRGRLGPDAKIKPEAAKLLQEVVENYMIELFRDAAECAQHAARITIDDRDLRLALVMRGEKEHDELRLNKKKGR
jgi:histone H3/H4